MVLTSPELIVLTLFAIGNTAAFLWFAGSAYGTPDHPTLAATVTAVRGNFSIVLLMIAAFYGGELVWRERDRQLNELIEFDARPELGRHASKDGSDLVVLLIVNLAAMATGLFYQLVEGAREVGIAQYLGWLIIPAAIDGLLIAVLAVFVQVLSPNKYVGWGILFVWFVGGDSAATWAILTRFYTYDSSLSVPLSDFVGAGNFWKGAAVLQFYWFCFAVILAVAAHLIWPRGTDLGLRVRLKTCAQIRDRSDACDRWSRRRRNGSDRRLCVAQFAQLNRYRNLGRCREISWRHEKKYLKYEKLPMPSVTQVTA